MVDESGLLLNIVCETPAAVVSRKTTKNTGSKRKSKYEKRRERSQRAKAVEGKEEQHTTSRRSTSVDAVIEGNVTTLKMLEDEAPVIVAADDDDGTYTKDDRASDPAIDSVAVAGSPATDFQERNMKNAPQSSTNDEQPPLKQQHEESVTSAPSRKRHFMSLEQEEERARYMQEFHARPMEMDRKSSAKSNYTASKPSTHLFQSTETTLPLLHPTLLQHCQTHFGMKTPTPIQQSVWHEFSKHATKNLFVHSETGSGKTLAYLLPIVQSLTVDPNDPTQFLSSNRHDDGTQQQRRGDGTRCLIICPTRELASQTATAVELLTRPLPWLVCGCLTGGEKRKSEKARLRKGISILVATPGRLLDHLCKTECFLLSLKGKLQYLVLDESDRLLDFGDVITQIVQRIRANQPNSGRNGITWRSLLVSATISQKEEALAKILLGGDEWIWAKGHMNDDTDKANLNVKDNKGNEGSHNKASTATTTLMDSTPRQLCQWHMTVTAKLRLATLVSFLVQRVHKKERTVVFMSTCDGVDYHHALFQAMDSILTSSKENDVADGKTSDSGIFGHACPLYKLHGNVPHLERQTILTNFNKASSCILLATDVAARGLNLRNVHWTIQYDPPCEVSDYAHRAGRAARAGNAGHSLLFLLPSERQFLEVLALKGVDRNMEALSLAHTLNRAADICSQVTAESKAGFRNKGEAFSSEIQRRLEDVVVQEDSQAKAAAASNKKSMVGRKKGRAFAEQSCGKLLEMGRQAFFSYIRAYPTKEKAMRHIFSSRALHVGHIARSFALSEPPKSLMRKVVQQSQQKNDDDEKKNQPDTKKRKLAFENATPTIAVANTKQEGRNTTMEKKRQRTKVSLIKPDGTVDSTKARMMLMENATKLQQGGMDSF